MIPRMQPIDGYKIFTELKNYEPVGFSVRRDGMGVGEFLMRIEAPRGFSSMTKTKQESVMDKLRENIIDAL